ncbi:MAG TPA: SdiA-regulated domain-containing protein [Salinimicrobium sp.]|nr:SdiA-regulated domain-containing protein [Salinimicrobium sp.]
MKKILFILIAVVAGMGTIFLLSFKDDLSSGEISTEKNYKIVKRWELPKELKEISGIEWIGENTIACVQDEKGVIFLYDLEKSEIVNQIPFGGGGDYEGIAFLNNDAFILRSDGMIYRVNNYQSPNRTTEKIKTILMETEGLDIEGLCTDTSKNRLLLAVKEKEDGDNTSKEIYAFDLETEQLRQEPVYTLNLNAQIFDKIKEDPDKRFTPSEIEINPVTGEIYILDGSNPKLLITGKNAMPKELYFFDKNQFNKPEGLTFSPEGKLFISNEAGDEPANILLVNLN